MVVPLLDVVLEWTGSKATGARKQSMTAKRSAAVGAWTQCPPRGLCT